MNPSTVLFAIEAGIRLGNKINQVLIDKTLEGPLLLPLGDMYNDIPAANAQDFFDDNINLISEGGAYYHIRDDEAKKLAAYKTIMRISATADTSPDSHADAISIITNLNAFEQYKDGFGSKPVFQRILGTIVEIGIDYVIANPDALGDNSNTRKYIEAFLKGIDDTTFAEGKWDTIVTDMFESGLTVLNENLSDIIRDERAQVIVGGVTSALIDDVKDLPGFELTLREEFFKRVGTSIFRGAVEAFGENTELFIKGDSASKTIIRSTLSQVINGIKDKEDLFSNESLKLIVKSAMLATSENAALLTDNPILERTISRSLAALTETDSIFSEASVAIILAEGLHAVGENVATLIDTSSSQRAFLADAISGMSLSLASSLSDGNLKDLFSMQQLIDLTEIVLKEVAEDPERLLGDTSDDLKKSVLVQIIASVSAAFGSDPKMITTGERAVSLVEDVMNIALMNADKLLDISTDDPQTNLLYQIIQSTVSMIIDADDPRHLLNKKVIHAVIINILEIASNNIDVIAVDQQQIIKDAIRQVISIASDALEDKINGSNLPTLIAAILKDGIYNDLDLNDDGAVQEVINLTLKNLPGGISNA